MAVEEKLLSLVPTVAVIGISAQIIERQQRMMRMKAMKPLRLFRRL